MPEILDKQLYQNVKLEADKIYKHPSAYKSGYIVKRYKELGGKYKNDSQENYKKVSGARRDGNEKPLNRWFEEKWQDIGGLNYPVYRPTIRINKNTPLTVDEIDPKQAKEQIKLKQIIKGEYNLPKFEGKGIWEYSNPTKVFKKAKELFGDDVNIKISDKPPKKYMILNPNTNKWIHFGLMPYEDFTKSNNIKKRYLYLRRTENMRGNWKQDPFSRNNLSRNLLW
jgi:hypothetical protein